MKQETFARIMFPFSIVYFLVVFIRFCVLTFQAREWGVLIMGIFPFLGVLGLFVDFLRKAKRQKPITERDIRIAFAFF